MIKNDSVIILPIGAVEEHGSHLPLSTDSIQPLYVAERAAKITGALIAPLIPYGICNTTKDYPGTLSLTFEAMRLTVRDILTELVRNGFRKIIVLSGHAGKDHMSALRIASRDVVEKEDVLIAVLSDYDIIYEKNLLPEDDGHAGMGETSRVMAERPDLVKDRPKRGKGTWPKYLIIPNSKQYWSGYVGDPSKASANFGNKLDKYIVTELVKIIQDMQKRQVRN